MPLKELILITVATTVISHVVARWARQEGFAEGKKEAERDVQLAFFRGAATVRLNDARQVDIITEIDRAC